MKKITTILLIGLLAAGCKKETFQVKIWQVADDTFVSGGLFGNTMECLLIRENDNQSWQPHCFTIEGFEYEKGFEYVIEVHVYTVDNPPADGSSLRYVLKKIISKK